MYCTIIAACDFNRVIGSENKIPWHVPEDLKLFRSLTLNNTVIMGRKTWESIGEKPLPKRHNIVITRNFIRYREKGIKGVLFVDSLEEAIKSSLPDEERFIIGGAQIYQETIEKDFANKAVISLIKRTFSGDTKLPEFGPDWITDKVTDFDDFTTLEMRRII